MFFFFILLIHVMSELQSQSGPDPWDYGPTRPVIRDEVNLPPDIKLVVKRKTQIDNKLGINEWFFRRLVTIVLKGGQTKVDDDGSVDISLQMKFDPKQWEILSESLKSDTPLSEDMLRRTVGYIQESIYKPTIIEKISMAWSEYIQLYLTEYKTHITWTLGALGAAGALLLLWSHMSHKHVFFILFLIFYAYEGVISYKEAEQKEVEIFRAAMDSCKWYFWLPSLCTVPTPDPLVFMKHMNPLKILVRMFTTALAEPIVAINETIDVILQGLTDGLFYPFNKITYAILAVVINISLIYFFIMILFNWLLNIPFHIGFGLFGVSIRQRERNLFFDNNNAATVEPPRNQETERISEATVNKMLNVFLALSNNAQNMANSNPMLPQSSSIPIRRSASTGRLPSLKSSKSNLDAFDNVDTRRRPFDGSGDA